MATPKSLEAIIRGKKQSLQAQSGRRAKTVKPQPGKSRFRILPSWRGGEDETFFHDFGQHFIKDLAGNLKAVYICSEKTFGKPCPICEALAEGITSAGNDDLINAMKEGQSKGKILVNALHLDGDDPSTPVILELTPTTFEKVLDVFGEFVAEGVDPMDLENGIDIIINRSGKGLNTEYSVMQAVKSNPVDPAVMKQLHNLDEYVAQEYDEGKTKALAAVAAVSGALPAPGMSSADKPLTAAPEDDEPPFDGDYEAVAPTKTENSAAVDDALSDDELDAMLSELDD